MKFTLSVLEKHPEGSEKSWPAYMLGGRIRTSTLVLVIAFLAVWWTYDHYRPEVEPKPPAPQVVPPGFVPDPNYTWVPRTRVQPPQPSVTYTPRPTPTSTVPPPPPTSSVPAPTPTTTTTAPFQLPQLPCLLPAPFCPPSPSPSAPPPQAPQPGPGPVPSSRLPAS
ncbi:MULTISPECIES: hypothetical protein [unclassified Mycobacterium]|uniref:hypothetical protein n=1 Tax=unclassified Mycobacterium TaxID=2642494 RepID=UPI0007FC401B|nr:MULTISPECIES: hypothetical protein [unclassified Mycobacterium]OBG76355.1 hypothetical protein A5700_22045 [Mycobacterium sp. E1214]OBH26372.1 hypothetical protein A5693_03690 [Mycobacterium sp. E1319]